MSTLEPVQPSPDQEALDLDQHLTVVVPFMPIDFTPPSWDLPPFSGKATRCVKCGVSSDHIPASYHDRVSVGSPCYTLAWQGTGANMRAMLGPFPEHIDRRCPTCNYQWVEGLVDPYRREED